MKTTIHYKNIPEPARLELEARIRDLAWRHLERHLARFSPDLVELHVELEKSNHRNLHRVRLRLWLPGGTLVSGEESDELADAMLQSYAELPCAALSHADQRLVDIGLALAGLARPQLAPMIAVILAGIWARAPRPPAPR